MFETIRKVLLPCFATIAVLAWTSHSARADLADPIGHWTFDNTYTDLAQGNDASVNGGSPTFTTDAAVGTHALSVAAANAVASVSNLPTGNSPRTLSFWMRADSIQDQAPVSWGTKDASTNLFESLVRSNSTVVGHF